MINENEVCYKTRSTHLSWGGIFAGALVAVGLGFLLSLYGVAIGLSAYSSDSQGAVVIAIGGLVALLLGVVISMAIAGFVSGYISRFFHCYCHGGIIYGFLTWSLALILSALLFMPLSHYVTFYESTLMASLVTDEPTQATDAGVNSDEDKASTKAQQRAVSPQPSDAASKSLAWKGWIVFGLFFLGALSSCIGACIGMRCQKKETPLTSL